MHQIRFGWGSAVDTPWGAYSAPQAHLDLFKGPTSKRKEGREVEEMGEIRGRGKEEKENGDRSPTIFGLKVALPILLQYFAKICLARGLALRCRLWLNPESEVTKRE